jgi:uncharacterized protein (DUF433 family)
MSQNGYQHLEHRPGANYKQMYVKGRKIRAIVLYGQTQGEDARAPEQVAQDYDLPVETVKEAIDYCIHNADVLREDYESESASLKRLWEKHPPVVPPGYVPES